MKAGLSMAKILAVTWFWHEFSKTGLTHLIQCYPQSSLVTVTGPSVDLFLISRRSTVYRRQSSTQKLKRSLPMDQLLWVIQAFSAQLSDESCSVISWRPSNRIVFTEPEYCGGSEKTTKSNKWSYRWLVQERRNSIANALELRLSCSNLSISPLLKLEIYISNWS